VVRQITIAAEADEEVSDAYSRYEGKEPGLGDRFLLALKRSILAAAAQPEFYPLRLDAIRRITVAKFPYSVYFEHDDHTIYIQSVFHESRDPSRLNRLRNK